MVLHCLDRSSKRDCACQVPGLFRPPPPFRPHCKVSLATTSNRQTPNSKLSRLVHQRQWLIPAADLACFLIRPPSANTRKTTRQYTAFGSWRWSIISQLHQGLREMVTTGEMKQNTSRDYQLCCTAHFSRRLVSSLMAIARS